MDKNNINLFHQSVFAMNTQLDVLFWGHEKQVYNAAFQCIVEEVEKLENTLSRYRPGAELYRLNHEALLNFVDVSQTLWDAIKLGKYLSVLSKGYFDITLGSVYHAIKKGELLKPMNQKPAKEHVAMNEKCRTVCYLKPGITIDFGGMGKGMALQNIAAILDKHNIFNAFISFGSSSVLTRGSHPHGNYWPFGLAMYDPDSVEWKLNNDSVSVSSTTRMVNHQMEYHIVNPKNHQPVHVQRTAIVQAKNPVHAEVLSTALLASPTEEHDSIIKNFEVENYQVICNKTQQQRIK